MHLPDCLCCEPLPVPTQGLCCLQGGPQNQSGQVFPLLKASAGSLLPVLCGPHSLHPLAQPTSPQASPAPSFRLLFCHMQPPPPWPGPSWPHAFHLTVPSFLPANSYSCLKTRYRDPSDVQSTCSDSPFPVPPGSWCIIFIRGDYTWSVSLLEAETLL